MEEITRERFLTAIRNEQPTACPAPDISNMIPARLTGRPFWDIYYHNNPPLWRAYLEAVRYFGIDGWFIYGAPEFSVPVPVEHEQTSMVQNAERWVTTDRVTTPAGDLYGETTDYIADPPTRTVKFIKDLRRDWDKVRYLFQEPISCDLSEMQAQRRELGELGVYGLRRCPGSHICSPHQGSLRRCPISITMRRN